MTNNLGKSNNFAGGFKRKQLFYKQKIVKEHNLIGVTFRCIVCYDRKNSYADMVSFDATTVILRAESMPKLRCLLSVCQFGVDQNEIYTWRKMEDVENPLIEPSRGKTNNVVSDHVRHKPACTSTEKI